MISEVKESFTKSDGTLDTSNSSLLEIFALEIQLCQGINDNKRLRMIYPQTLELSSVINDPKVTAIVKECGGKMHMEQKQWSIAIEELYEAFEAYQMYGKGEKAKQILKYVILGDIISDAQVWHADT